MKILKILGPDSKLIGTNEEDERSFFIVSGAAPCNLTLGPFPLALVETSMRLEI
jgi:hypothetical protein